METESVQDKSALYEKLNLKLISRPGSLELIERGVLEVEPNLKDIIRSGEVTFRRVSSDETDNSGSSPSLKILKHQEALDEVTARRLSLAAQQQRQLIINQEKPLCQISEQAVNLAKSGSNKSCHNTNTNAVSGNPQRSLVTGQISRFKGLVFHNYCPAGSKENQEIREQQQEKYIQLQEGRNSAKNINSQPVVKNDKLKYQNKCSRCVQAPDRVSSLNDLTVAQLKTECRLRGLSRSGNKSSLITTLTPFKEEILAIENACSHLTSQTPVFTNHNTSSKLQMNDRSISLPTEYYENVVQEPLNNLVAPLTFNVTCFSGSISNLSFGSYPIMISDQNQTDSQEQHSSENFNSTKQSSDVSIQSSEIVNLSSNPDLQHQLVMNSSSICYPTQIENNSHPNNTLMHPPTNPLLFYKLPTLSGQEPAFIQTNGLEMIQLVQQELLRNIECQSQMSSDQEPEINQNTLQHQRYVLVNFLNQLIQKTPAFHNCQQLTNDQQKIYHWINNFSSFDYQAMSQVCMDNTNTNSSQSLLAYLHQQPYSANPSSDQMMEQYGENDLLNLINEVVTEEEMKTNAENVHKEIQRNNLLSHLEMKPPNSPMQTDSQVFNEVKSITKSNSNENSRGGDQKRAAWLQKVSPRLYKATSNNANSELPFSAFNFDFSGGSLISGCGSRTSSEGCGSINSSITDAQILSPGTEKVLFETIFQHTNSGSSMENDIFSSTMNMEDVSNN